MNQTPADRDAYVRLGRELTEQHSNQLSAQLAVFQSALVNFAIDHGDSIKTNGEFRHKFTQMCQSVGLDPLELLILESGKSKKSPGFYAGVGVRLVEICQETRNINGGLISLKELHSRLQESVSVPLEVTDSDLQKALDTLAGLGKAYEVVMISNKQWIRYTGATGDTMSTNQKKVYELCEFTGGHVTRRLLHDNYGWDKARIGAVVDDMISGGFLWIDAQGPGGEPLYWVPSWISD